MSEFLLEIMHHLMHHSLKLLPFLFVTYLIMGAIEHVASENTHKIIQKAGKFGPIWGSICGAFPQCGFSAAASYFYVGRVITLGTLISIYMSTSDEMLPILISAQVPVSTITKIILVKVAIGMVSGFIVEFFFSWLGKKDKMPKDFVLHNSSSCGCGSDHGIFLGAVKHSLRVWIFIVIISLVIEIIVHTVGEQTISLIFSDIPVLGEMIAGLVGLIPNCGASVVITQLYLDGIIGIGPMMSGLLVSAGVGLLVLYKENHHLHENILITAILYVISVGWGVLIGLLNITF